MLASMLRRTLGVRDREKEIGPSGQRRSGGRCGWVCITPPRFARAERRVNAAQDKPKPAQHDEQRNVRKGHLFRFWGVPHEDQA
jgi:hypothetical protein